MGASSGLTQTCVQQNIGSVVYHNGRRLDESDVVHVGKREASLPGVTRVRLSETGKLLLDSKEIEEATAFDVDKGVVRVTRRYPREELAVPGVKRIDVLGSAPLHGGRQRISAVGDVSISCKSVRACLAPLVVNVSFRYSS